ncbi:MAG: SMC-Scp complex subunit ScpB [Alphaproteobacteria bacterium]
MSNPANAAAVEAVSEDVPPAAPVAANDVATNDTENTESTASRKRARRVRKVATSREDSLALLEAALFASSEPLNARELSPYIAEGESIDSLMQELAQRYESGGVRLEEAGRAWSFRTASEYGQRLTVVRERKRRISRAAAETLAVIAYHQPVTRGQIEEIRGVALSTGTLDILLEAGWVAPQGRAEQVGHPLLWGTTGAFLDQFNLKNLEDLPAEQELRASGLLDNRAALAVVSERVALEKRESEDSLPDDETLLEQSGVGDGAENPPTGEQSEQEGGQDDDESVLAETLARALHQSEDESESGGG